MSRVERFFHVRPSLDNGGATVRVVGDTAQVGQVDVQVAFCHTKGHTPETKKKADAYCKKSGRATALQKVIKVVPLRYLPLELERIYEVAAARAGVWYERPDYSFAMKYFLPKE